MTIQHGSTPVEEALRYFLYRLDLTLNPAVAVYYDPSVHNSSPQTQSIAYGINSHVRVRRSPKRPVRVDVVNVSQVRRRPELEVIRPEVIRSRTAGTLEVARSVPVDGVVVLAEIQFGVIAALVPLLELIAGAVEGARDVAIRAAASFAVDFERHGVSDPIPRAVLTPFHDSVFPVGFVANVFLEVDAVVCPLFDCRSVSR